jgi:hypothetical protein
LIVRFSCENPVGKNQRLQPVGNRMIRTSAARYFMSAVGTYGLWARDHSEWPRNIFVPKRVRLSVEVYNTRHDAAAVSPLVADALEGIFYLNDKIVEYGPQQPPTKDAGARRAEISVELLERYSEQEAQRRRDAQRQRIIRRNKGR